MGQLTATFCFGFFFFFLVREKCVGRIQFFTSPELKANVPPITLVFAVGREIPLSGSVLILTRLGAADGQIR